MELIKLVVPVLISLVVSNGFSILRKSLLYATISNFAILFLGSLWFWTTVKDGLAQITQAAVYGISFIVILVINFIVVTKRRKILH